MSEISFVLVKFPISLIVMFLILRLMGNKELQQSTPIDFSFMVLLASITWDMALGDRYTLFQTIIMMGFLSLLIFVFDFISSKSKRIEKIVVGEPKVLIKDGEFNEDIMKIERISVHELESRLRLKGVFDVEEVEVCYLEMNGEISVKVKSK